MHTSAYEKKAEQFLAEITEEHYRNGAGLKKTLDIEPIYERHRSLFSRPTVARLLRGRGAKAGRMLTEFAAFGLMENETRSLTEAITNAETQAAVRWDGKDVTYRYAWVVLMNEPDAARRHDLESRIEECTLGQDPLRAERFCAHHFRARGLGFRDYTSMCRSLTGVDCAGLARRVRSILSITRAAYFRELRFWLSTLGLKAGDATWADIRHLFRASQFDEFFPKRRLIRSLRNTLAGLGIDLEAQSNVTLDTDARPLKSPRAFCAPVRVPGDVRLVIMPRGGQDDYVALFHEAGHTEHFANCDRDLPFPYRCLGDNAITECYAFLLEHLVRDRLWQKQFLGASPPARYFRLLRFHALWMIRRYSAKLLYELQLHEADDALSGRAAYERVLGDALGIRISGANALYDVDPHYYCACYLRAWLLEAQLRRRLAKDFGARWFASKDAGAFLRSLWSQGQRWSADELSRRLGHRSLTESAFLSELLAPR